MEMTGNTIVITGGTSGIGLAFAERFLELGNKVIICGRREERLIEIKKRSKDIVTRLCDISKTEQRNSLASWVISNYPETNILINNAGVQLVTDFTGPVNMEKVNEEIETNLTAPIHLSSLFTRHFANRKNSAIINITSGLAFAPISSVALYCATKSALHSISLSMRHQLKNANIKIFEIAPPSVDTELGKERRSDPNSTHGGIHVDEFLKEAMEAIRENVYEYAVGMAENMRQKREALFPVMNH